ncbi:hypothetical protein Lser_V15G39590 [Lactuca serriola]
MLSTRSGSTHQLLGVYYLANHGANLILLAYPFAFSGKSTVLNSLIGHLALPTGEGGATRAPICIELKRDGNLSSKSIVMQIDRKSQPVSAISSKSRDEIFLKLKTSLGEGEGIQFHGMLRVVQQSLLGSILANMLLVLGCTFFCGGIFLPKKEHVLQPNIVMSSGLLLMAVMGLLFPAILHFKHTELHFGKLELALSRFSSYVVLITYGAYLFLQLTTQKNSYSPITEIPFCVVVGWIMGRPLDLNFQLFETTTLIMTVLVVAFMLQDGTSNYFKGVMLVFCYLIVAASFFVHIDPLSIQDKP